MATDLDIEWGERIPDNGRLKAMREMLQRPILICVAAEQGKAGYLCPFCGRHDKPEHKPDCPWKRAQEEHNADTD